MSSFPKLPVSSCAVAVPLHERLRRARERARLTQADVAAALEVSLRTVGNWETGSSAPRNRLGALEALLGERFGADATDAAADDDAQLPVGSGIDPKELDSLTPDDVEAVKAVIRALRSARGEN